MQRRAFVLGLTGAVAVRPWLGTAHAGDDRFRTVGILIGNAVTDKEGKARMTVFRKALAGAGWKEGDNLRLEIRWFAGDFALAKTYAAELVAIKPDVVVVNGTVGIEAIRAVSRTVPTVFVLVGFPVGSGYVTSLAHPGGNTTGFSAFEPEIGGKWFETLKEIAPHLKRVAGLLDPRFKAYAEMWRTSVETASHLGLAVTTIGFNSAADIEPALAAFARTPDGGMIVMPTPSAAAHRKLIIATAARYRLPTVYPFRYYATSGGLISYGLDTVDLFRRSAGYVDRILRGANPGDLPVQAPTKFEMVVNLKTAKALGITVPRSILLRADEVIE